MSNPTYSSTAGSLSDFDRRNEALDAQGRLGYTYMKQARRIIREDVPIMKHALEKCETEQQKRDFVARVREEDGMGAYLAYCAQVPGDVVEEEEDHSNTQKHADWAYHGPYVKPWHCELGKRTLERNEQGTPVSVKDRERALFGDWTKSWQDGPSRAEENLLLDLGPKGEVVCSEPPQPWGWSFDELAEMQRVRKEEYERERKRERREESEWRGVVRRLLRRVRARFSVSRAVPEKANGAGEVPVVRKADSGYESLAKSR